MPVKKKKSRPPSALSFKVLGLARSARKAAMANKKKNKSISLVDLAAAGVVASGSSVPVTNSASIPIPSTPRSASAVSSGSLGGPPVGSLVGSQAGSVLSSKDFPPLLTQSTISPFVVASTPCGTLFSSELTPAPIVQSPLPPLVEASNQRGGSTTIICDPKPSADKDPQAKNYAALLKSSTQLQEMGSPSEHVSGAPFVLIPDENIEAAKLEFKDFIYARFHGDYPSMGKIIGVVSAVWARTGPRIFVHNLGQGMYLLRVTNPRTREVLLSRTCWNIGGLPMFVAPWSPEYSPEEPPLTSAIVPVEMRNVPYLLFNNESLSRLATAVGKPESLFPETERKENFEVAKLYVRVDLTVPLPHKIISGFSNGKEVQIDVSYPWLPVKCDLCKKFGHKKEKCSVGVSEGTLEQSKGRKQTLESPRRRSKSRPGRSTDKKIGKKAASRYVPVTHDTDEAPEGSKNDDSTSNTLQETKDLEEGEITEGVIEKPGLSVGSIEQPSEVVQDGVGGFPELPPVSTTPADDDGDDQSTVTIIKISPQRLGGELSPVKIVTDVDAAGCDQSVSNALPPALRPYLEDADEPHMIFHHYKLLWRLSDGPISRTHAVLHLEA
ncbi:hypothetical protein Bca4012_064186 [Brassica carinata]